MFHFLLSKYISKFIDIAENLRFLKLNRTINSNLKLFTFKLSCGINLSLSLLFTYIDIIFINKLITAITLKFFYIL